MNFIKLEEIIWKYRRFFTLLTVVTIIQFFELVLLYYKYDIFTGGFLQPFSYLTFYDRAIFIILTLWFDLMLFGFFSILWFSIADKLNKSGTNIYYIFIFFTLLIMGGWLAFKFKVLSYFNDALNFQIMKNLAGGSIQNAFAYISNEIFLFAVVVCVLAIIFIISSRYFRKISYPRSFPLSQQHKRNMLWMIVIAVFLTPVITLFVAGNDKLRYGMEKKSSFYIISAVLDKLSDIDFDGYGSFSFPHDQAIFNADIYPRALDIPGNAIDEDGFLGDAVVPDTRVDSFTEIIPQRGKHIVLIVLESARADLLEKKINGQYVAPVLREIAKKGAVVEQAYSHTGYTVTSMKAIFNRNIIERNSNNLLGFLQKSGYQQSIISGQDESFGGIADSTGMKQEGVYYFDARMALDDRVFVSKEASSLRLSEERVVQQFKLRVKQLDFSRPQFIYLNFQAAHFPYSHPKMSKRITQNLIPRSEINIENKQWLAETYWNALANADWAVGEVVSELEKYQVFNNTTIVILGDHGESLFDDGFLGHGHAINDVQTRIPLIINDSDLVVQEAIGQVDVAEIIVRSALGLKNSWLDKDKPIFQIVGSLNRPVLIAHVRSGEGRIIFDFRSEMVFFSDTKQWMDYKEALNNPEYKERVELLIRDWEDLRWLAHQEHKTSH